MIEPPEPPDKPHHLGHRRRLRERFLSTGGESMQDYELAATIV
jgi:DNA repair protein RadC